MSETVEHITQTNPSELRGCSQIAFDALAQDCRRGFLASIAARSMNRTTTSHKERQSVFPTEMPNSNLIHIILVILKSHKS